MNIKNFSKQYLAIFISVFIIIFFLLIPPPAGLNKMSMYIIGVFIACLLLWFNSLIDWGSFFCILLIGFLPIYSFKEVFYLSFGNETFVFLLLTFLCTYSLSTTNFLKRCAIFFITSPIAKKGGWYFICSFFASVLFIGCFISPTVLFVVFLPILEEIYNVLSFKKGDKCASMLMLGLAFCTSISSGMTPIAHVFSTLAIGFFKDATGSDISYTYYMSFAIPVGIICAIFMIILFYFVLKPDISKLKNIDTQFLKNNLPKIDLRELLSVLIFLFVVILWILPSFLKNIFPNFYEVMNSFGNAFPPLVGVLLLSAINIKGAPLLPFTKAIKEVPWQALLMTAATLALGSAITNDALLIKQFLADFFNKNLINLTPFFITSAFVIWACIQTNFSSNLVTVTVVSNIALSFLLNSDTNVNIKACLALIGMISSFAFATPPSIAHIAIASSTGFTNTKQMFLYGSLLALFAILVAIFVGYPIANCIAY